MKTRDRIGRGAMVAAIVMLSARVHAADPAGGADAWWKPADGQAAASQPEPATDASSADSAPAAQGPEPASAPPDSTDPATPADGSAPARAAEAAIATIPAAAATPPAADSPTQLEDVVVTAQKREQRVVDVPINVSALGRDDIQRTRVEQVRDITGYIPNVDIKEQVPGAIPVVTIRGVGLDDFSSTNSPAAGIYVDQVTLSSLALMSFDLFDMERLEVLKGPQGTLYGRNSNAGAINVITASPSNSREGFLRAGYGNYQAKDLEGMYNLPLGDTVAVRVAAKWIKQDEGFWKSRLAAGDAYNGNSTSYSSTAPVKRDLGRRDILAGRVRLSWNPLDALTVNLKLEDLRQRSEMGQPEFFGTSCTPGHQPVDPDNCSDLLGYKDTDRDPYKGDWRGAFPYNIDQTSETLIADWDLGWAMLSSVTGHIGFKRYFHIDVDGTPADEFDFFQGDTVDQLTQELRLAGDADKGAWLVGLFYSSDHDTVNTPGRHQDLIAGETSLILADQKTHSEAVFGNVDWKVGGFLDSAFLRKFSVTTGLRYTQEGRAYVGGTDWSVNVPGTIDDTHEDSSITGKNWSYKGGLNFAPTSATLVYANTSRGVKSGGYFCGVTTNARQLKPYLPEQLTAYELGFKRAGLVALNASVFHYDYKDLQTFMRDGTAPVQFVGNVPEATVDGADVDTTIRVVDGLTAIAGVGYLKTELGAFLGPDGPDPDQNPDPHPAGNKLANAPELTWNALLRYELPVFRTGLSAALQGDAHYSDATFKEATNDPLIKAGAYTIYNARASLLPAGREWEVALWGRNLTNEIYVVQGADISFFGMGNHNYNAPRTFGADLMWHF